ncbi:MCE family protein [Nocardia stercoris]|uniref:MCE family protein n=1 Tax=Nocardia stercoris TaxID=2483361 RepID=A0A3M2KVK3_9NOCA|nr:MCE family protein [Nocardia stercoris]RMI28243.1 MCE family protein [Nocardia stercoris]
MAAAAAKKLVDKNTDESRWESGWRAKTAGAGLILGLAGVVAVAGTMFAGGFESTETVYVESPRAGLVLDTDAKVKLRGVEIGRVESVSYTGDSARLKLAMNPDQMRLVPANAGVSINSTTVFGAKYVNFTVPSQPSTQHLQAGDTVHANAVTVEFDTLFQHLTDVLGKVAPDKLNATLTAIGTALQGRGDELGQLLADSDTYLKDIIPSLPDLQRDLDTTATVGNIYADAAPDLLRTTSNASTTSGTLVAHTSDFDNVLLNLTGLANTAGGVLGENESQLTSALNLLRPTTSLLNEYSPALNCVVMSIASHEEVMNDIFGGKFAGVTLNAGIMPGGTPYKYPDDLPKVNATGGPHCEGTTDRVPGQKPNYLVTDTSEGHVYTPELAPHLNKTVFQLLFAGMPGV